MRRGQFTDDIGEDFLGLRELGIAAEFGLSSLSVPKRLLRGKRNAKGANAAYDLPLCLPPPRTHALLSVQFKVCRASATIPPTTIFYYTYLGEREEPGRLASQLLRASPRECRTRYTPGRFTKSCAGEAWPAWTGDTAEQRGHRRSRRFKEEGQAERRRCRRSNSRRLDASSRNGRACPPIVSRHWPRGRNAGYR